MSSPISSSSEYNSALDQTFNSTLSPENFDLSLTDSDIENVNLSREWNELLKPEQKGKNNDCESSQLLINSLRNNNVRQDQNQMPLKSPSKSLNGDSSLQLDSTISLDFSGISTATEGSSTLSVISSSDDSVSLPVSSDADPQSTQPNVSMISIEKEDDESPTTRDSKDTTHNVSLLPVDDDQLTESGTSQPETSKEVIKIYNSIEEFDANLPETVNLLTTPEGCKVYLVGTAHFSEKSQNDVSLVMRNVKPNVVMLELCPSRVHILKYDERTLLEEAKDINLAKIQNIIKTNGVVNGMLYILLLNMSAKITKKLGMAPGGEFRQAVKEAYHLPQCLIQLGDRQINITLQRALRGLSLWQTVKLVPKLLFMDDDITVEEMEQCKKKDLLEEIMLEIAGEFPAFGRVFVQERDLYLCHSLQVAALPQQLQDGSIRPVNVVGVVGIGHAEGIIKNWGKVESSTVASIVTIPPASFSHRAVKFIFKYGTLGLCAYGVFRIVRPRLSRFL
ncbi:traB domain-containing protein [Uranotaenia lowii]|uniref:traB domain-containing protein n=1 Tax=Uranotaenia lowii TaxID=190385 RepID=UPI002479260E|nr:traB domain-containing protein [Uranotaenia lowii]XP_055605616.1 traB domain-containing protein [Uranotaenia lowii]XP_055605623.1 traB domain-containing protein [Uranotaenia lowii]